MSGTVLLLLRLLLVGALYTFLGWALLTLWRDLKRQGEVLSSRQAPALTLLRRAGADLETLHFTIPDVSIGRAPTSDLALEDNTVSAVHARLSFHHGQWWVEDLNSRNGTFLNDEPVSQPLVITSGDELRCGQVALTIGIGTEASSQVDSSL
ncbi:MAG TPA: FHA domain-containing protein [Anaerolineales bacterium]|nr:FHA domain-containing protein [Anaerolineales bacterium]